MMVRAVKNISFSGLFSNSSAVPEDNICISNAQYYELNARRNLWCEILEF